MSSSPKPIKRSPELAPLSREHHEGLLFVWKIRQGLKNKTNIAMINAYVLWFWKEILQHHIKKEDAIFLHLLPVDTYLLRMSEEHVVIKKLFEENGELNEVALLNLASFIEKHIRFEERELFPHLERTLTAIQLQKASQQLMPAKVCNKWQDEFWIRKTT